MRWSLSISEFSPEWKKKTFNIFENYSFPCLKIPSIFQVRYRLFSAKGGKWVWGSSFISSSSSYPGSAATVQRQTIPAGTRGGWLCPDRAVLGHTTPLWGQADGSCCQPGLRSWMEPRFMQLWCFCSWANVCVWQCAWACTWLPSTGSRAVCEMGTPETLSQALFSALGIQLLGGRACDFRRAQQGWSQLAVLQNGDFPSRFLSQSQDLLFSAQLVSGLYSFTNFSTSNGHAAALLMLGTCVRKHTQVKVLGCLSCRALGLTVRDWHWGGVGSSQPGSEAERGQLERGKNHKIVTQEMTFSQTLKKILLIFSSAGLCWIFFSSSGELLKGLLLSEWQPDVHCKLPI